MATMRTVTQSAESLYKSSGSKHMGFSFSIATEKEAKEKLDVLWMKFPDATHICYAYILRSGLERSSDDGEPAGSAGKPILNALKSEKVVNVLVAVVRYYGGTKLGIPGLIDAYKSAAKMVLNESLIADIQVESMLFFQLSYEQQPIFMNRLNRMNYTKKEIHQNECFEMLISVNEEDTFRFIEMAEELNVYVEVRI
jgi:putative IMPACT (imprinted ancient) family translation regulator